MDSISLRARSAQLSLCKLLIGDEAAFARRFVVVVVEASASCATRITSINTLSTHTHAHMLVRRASPGRHTHTQPLASPHARTLSCLIKLARSLASCPVPLPAFQFIARSLAALCSLRVCASLSLSDCCRLACCGCYCCRSLWRALSLSLDYLISQWADCFIPQVCSIGDQSAHEPKELWLGSRGRGGIRRYASEVRSINYSLFSRSLGGLSISLNVPHT